jgi:hypothetical protein
MTPRIRITFITYLFISAAAWAFLLSQIVTVTL